MCGILFGREPRVSLSHVYMEAFELATSFLANMFAVVLIGLVLTETFPYVMTCLRARGRARTDQKNACIRRVLLDHLILFFLVAYAGGVTIYATLVPAFGVHYDVQWIHASVLFVLFALLSYWRPLRMRIAAGLFVVSAVLALELAQGAVAGLIIEMPQVVMIVAYNIGLFSFYFFAVMYSIAMRTKEYEHYVSTQKLFSWRRFIVVFTFVLVWGGAFFMFDTGSVSQESGREVQKAQDVTVRLKWLHSAQFAGLYMADVRNMYRNAGIRPVFIPLNTNSYPIDDVVNGKADFGIAGGLEIVRARAEGKPVVALAVFFQRDPLVAYTLASSSIVRYADLTKVRVGADVAPNGFSFARTEQLRRHGIDPETLDAVYAGPNQNEALLAGAIDVAFGYETSQADELRRKGYAVRILESDAPRAYGDLLFTSEATLASKPDIVAAFTRATLQGWEEALLHPDEAVDAVLAYDDGMNISMTPEEQRAFLEAQRTYLKPTDDFAIGAMDRAVWESMIRSLYHARLLENLIAPEDFMYAPSE